jgi:hypothetical protein
MFEKHSTESKDMAVNCIDQHEYDCLRRLLNGRSLINILSAREHNSKYGVSGATELLVECRANGNEEAGWYSIDATVIAMQVRQKDR